MALRITRACHGRLAERVLRAVMSPADVKSRPKPLSSNQEITPGYHWLEQHYTLSPWEMFYWNAYQYFLTREVCVGKDWRGNLFFIKESDSRDGRQERFARFIEGWELPQDYDADFLWKKWLEYRMAVAPTPAQCARMHKYQESKYDTNVLAIEWRRALDKESPPQERLRRYAEYCDQKWDLRRSKAINNQMQSQQWLITRSNQPDVQDKMWYGRFKGWYESYQFLKIDLLRPPKKQNLWKLEDDMRARKFIDRIENADYSLDPWTNTRRERYMQTPSHVVGKEVPKSVTEVKKRLDWTKMPRVPVGDHAMRITNENPIYGFSDDKEYDAWFAEQRKLLISARAELEQMKRDGYRPAEIGGDLDPYVASRPFDHWKVARKKRIELLDKARAERSAIENRKQDARKRLLGTIASEEDADPFKPFVETAVYTREFGKVEANRTRRRYLEGSRGKVLRPTATPIDDDDTEMLTGSNDAVKTVFGGKGTALFATSVGKNRADRPDVVRPNQETLDLAKELHEKELEKLRAEHEKNYNDGKGGGGDGK